MNNQAKGRLYVIDGLDGSGKSTQAERIFSILKEKNEKVMLISYPNYESPSSALVRMYLGGDFSKDANDVNAYTATSFYAVDIVSGYLLDWKRFYDEGYIIIAARYISSNAIHQVVKLPKVEWDEYLAWLSDYAYNKLMLPRPEKVFFLDMSRTVADKLITARYGGDAAKRDIHESNMEYLSRCQEAAWHSAEKEGWSVIHCCDGENPFPKEQITKEILNGIIEV